jgi:hypothetical protein
LRGRVLRYSRKPPPFGLSLSKPCLFFLQTLEKQGQPFDKLRVNGG